MHRPQYANPSDPDNFQHFEFSKGLALGCMKGGIHSFEDFVPSLLSTTYGLSKGIWAFASHPVQVSTELATSCRTCIEYLVENVSWELMGEIIPELKECVKRWHELEEEQKGYQIGYVIGRYGTDCLILTGCVRAVKLARNMKRASSSMVFERAAMGGVDLEEISLAAEKHFVAREEYRKNCHLTLGLQEKHIPGTNNFKKKVNLSQLHISVEELQELTEPLIGNGIPWRASFGEAGYMEIVDYKKIIGDYVVEETGKHIPTSIGAIHYNAQGGYHVVPISPTSNGAMKIKGRNG